MIEYYGVSGFQIAMRFFIAILVGTAIGVEREYRSRPAGMRTHVLVCVGACLVALMECCFAHENAQGEISFDYGRIAAQVVSGIGFLGAGTILTAKHKVTGLTTAASVWNAACLGLACGYGLYVVAVVGCAAVMIVLLLMQRVVHVNAIKKVEIKFIRHAETTETIDKYFSQKFILVLDMDLYVEKHESCIICTNVYELRLPVTVRYTDVVQQISEFEHVQSVRTMDV